MVTAVFVLVRIFANPLSNVFQKQLTQRLSHPLFIITVVHAALTVLCLPYAVIGGGGFHVPTAVWINMLIAALGNKLTGNPKVNEPVTELIKRDIRIQYGESDGQPLEAIVLFAPHPTGNPEDWKKARPFFNQRMKSLGDSGRLTLNAQTGHLMRTLGSCVFCTMLQIGPCDYKDEIQSLATPPALLSVAAPAEAPDKPLQTAMLDEFMATLQREPGGYDAADDFDVRDSAKFAED